MGRELHSGKVPGDTGNYGWPVKFDLSGGYVGITQDKDNGDWARVLLSPDQIKALVEFLKSPRKRRP